MLQRHFTISANRLWLTAESHPKFSAILTESCLKVTYESPPGLKRNLQRTLNAWGSEAFESRVGGGTTHSQTVFALAWFHAVVQERRTYIPQGWCKFYEFSDGDLKAGHDALDQLQKQQRSAGGGGGEINWDFVHGLYANAIYGGRVDDAHDIKILWSYLKSVFNGESVAGRRPLGPFKVPSSGDPREFADIANGLPEEDKPSMFGLPANIERSHQRLTSAVTISQLKVLIRSVSGAAKFERDKWQKELTPILNLWKKLNQGSSLLQVKLATEEAELGNGGGDVSPIKAFVELEFRHGVSLLQKMHRSLSGLSKVIRGQQLLDEEVSKLADSLLRQETPAKWLSLWDGPEDPMDYIETVVAKINEVEKWKSGASSLLSKDLDLSDLFHPDTFLGALRQETARQFGVSMDDLKLANSWARGGGGISGSKIAIRVEGLMVEGALFDGGKLAPTRHDSPTYSVAPTCTLAWIPKGERDHYAASEAIRLPMYYSNERETIVAQLDMPCAANDQDKWLQSGTVLFINSHL